MAPAQPTPVIQLRLNLRGRQTPPRSSGHLVAQEGLFMNPAPSSPSPAQRPPPGWPRFCGRGKLGQPLPGPPSFPSPSFLQPVLWIPGRAGTFSRPVEPVGGHALFWEWEAGSGVTLSSTLDSGGDSGLLVPEEEIEKETATFLVKRETF